LLPLITVVKQTDEQVFVELVSLRNTFEESLQIDANERLARVLQSRKLAHGFETGVQAVNLSPGEVGESERAFKDVLSV